MNEFKEHWHFITNRRGDISSTQSGEEMGQIFNMIRSCESYLEVGTAEGDSLYVFSLALSGRKPIVTYVDIAEKHTEPYRKEVIDILKLKGFTVRGVHGYSQKHEIAKEAAILAPFDAVFIDGDHSEVGVLCDAMTYGPLARKYLIFHDIALEPVGKVFDWYCRMQGYKNVRKVMDIGTKLGYGVIIL